MRSSAAAQDVRQALLGASAQQLNIGLLAARTAAVLRRVANGGETDEVDREVLQSARAMLTNTADAVELIASGGRLQRDPGSFTFGAMAVTAELTAGEVPAGEVPTFLRQMASVLEAVDHHSDPDAARRVLPAFSDLAELATSQAGTVGEGGRSLL